MRGILASLMLLGGCALVPVPPPPARFDLGPPPALDAGSAWPLRLAEVSAPPWLDSPGIAYRLAWRDALRREHYRDSRWAAAPAALLGQRLREQLVWPRACTGPAPLLAVSLDEFEQVFSAPDRSHVVLRLGARLGAGAEQRWQLERPAPSPDAQGAARGLTAAVDALVPELNAWLARQACR